MRAWELFEGIQLNEVIEDNLYHYMSPQKALSVFSSDDMPGKWVHNIPELGEVKGNSFTRNKRFSGSSNNRFIKLTVDKNKLQANNKIIPLDAEKVYTYTRKRQEQPKNASKFSDIRISDRSLNKRFRDHAMSEEFVVGDIVNLNRMLIKIEIVQNPIISNELDANQAADLAEEYAEKHGIEFVDHRPKRPDWYDDE